MTPINFLIDFSKLFFNIKEYYSRVYKELENEVYTIISASIILGKEMDLLLHQYDEESANNLLAESQINHESIEKIKTLFKEIDKNKLLFSRQINQFNEGYWGFNETCTEESIQIIRFFRYRFDRNIDKFFIYFLNNFEHHLEIIDQVFSNINQNPAHTNLLKKARDSYHSLSSFIRQSKFILDKLSGHLIDFKKEYQAFIEKMKTIHSNELMEDNIQILNYLEEIEKGTESTYNNNGKIKTNPEKVFDFKQQLNKEEIFNKIIDDESDMEELILKVEQEIFGNSENQTDKDSFLNPDKITQQSLNPARLSDNASLLPLGLKINRHGIFLAVLDSNHSSKKLSLSKVENFLRKKKILITDRAILNNLLVTAPNEYIKIADYTPSEECDGKVLIQVQDKGMLVYMNILPPIFNGRSVDKEDVYAALKEKGIIYGIKESVIQEAIDNQIFNTYLLIAIGRLPVDGKNGYYEYSFRTNLQNVEPLIDEKGKANHKELNLIQNVAKGTILARRKEPTQGTAGENVFGQSIPAHAGTIHPINLGENVEESLDGRTIIATKDGHAQFKNNTISVSTVYIVPGDLDYNTGNIHFLGSVLVLGNVIDGFSIEATGDIEIKGTVGKCNLISENNILIHQGIYGKEEGELIANGDVCALFANNVKLIKAQNVFIAKELINCQVITRKNIECTGKKSSIVGGTYYSAEKIIARTLGNSISIPTKVEINLSPDIIMKHHQLYEEKNKHIEEINKLRKNLEYFKQMEMRLRGVLPEDKVQKKHKTIKQLTYHLNALKETNYELKKIKHIMDTQNPDGSIIVLEQAYPEVSVHINNAAYTLKVPMKKVQFREKNGVILPFVLDQGIKKQFQDQSKVANLKHTYKIEQ